MNIIKKSIALVLIISMFMVPITTTYAEDLSKSISNLQVPIKVSSRIKNSKGEVEQYFSPGDYMYLEYTITPNDIPLSSLPDSKPVDIALVLDTSGSMEYASSTFSDWLDGNVKSYMDFDEYMSDLLKDGLLKVNTNYETWKSENATQYSYDNWKKSFCTAIGQSDWIKRYELSFEDWIKENNIKRMTNSYDDYSYYWNKYISPGIKKNDYTCTLCDSHNNQINKNSVYNHYISKHLGYVYNSEIYSEDSLRNNVYDNIDNKYKYNGNYTTYAKLQDIYNDNAPLYLYNGNIYSEKSNELLNLWTNSFKDKYYYDGEWYTEKKLNNYYNENIFDYTFSGYYADDFNRIYYNYYGGYYSTKYTYEKLYQYWYRYYNNSATNSLYYYNKKEYTYNQLQTEWNKIAKTTRIDEAKKALLTFIDKLLEDGTGNKDFINISLVTFLGDATLKFSSMKLTDPTLKSQIANITIPPEDDWNGTNGGDGLRLASYTFSDDKSDSTNKFVVFLTDGENNRATYESSRYGSSLYYGKDQINMNNNLFPYNSSSTNYAYNVAKDLVYSKYSEAKGYIKTYVVGVGDGSNSNQRTVNQNVCAYANYGKQKDSTTDISNLYFPVNDASKLSNLYGQIAHTILSEIPVKNVNIEIPFKCGIQISGINETIPNIVDVTVNGEKYAGLAVSEENDKLLGSLPEFQYTLDKKDGIYKASPMVLSIKIKLPDEIEGIIETIEAKLTYNVFDDTQSTVVPAVKAQIIKGMKPLKVEAVLNIKTDESAKLSYKVKEDSEEDDSTIKVLSKSIRLKIVEDSEDEKDYVGGTYNSSSDGVISLTKSDLQKFTSSTIYIETQKKIQMPGGEERVLKGTTPVYILSNGVKTYNKTNYTSTTERDVEISFKAPSNNLDIQYTSNGNTITSSDVAKYSSGTWTKNMILKKGTNNMAVTATNSYGNSTVYEFSTDINCTLPAIASKSFKANSIEVTFTSTSNTMDKAVINVYNSAKELVQTVNAVQNATNKQKFTASFTSIPLSYSDTIEIDGLDIYKNGVIEQFKFASLIDFGLYDKNKNEFFSGTPNVVEGCRYTYGVKFVYNGQSKIKLSPDNAELKINGFSGSIKDLNTNNVLTESTNKFKMVQGEPCVEFGSFSLENGKEYLLLFDIVFSSDTDISTKNINLLLELDTEGGSKSIMLQELPNVE